MSLMLSFCNIGQACRRRGLPVRSAEQKTRQRRQRAESFGAPGARRAKPSSHSFCTRLEVGGRENAGSVPRPLAEPARWLVARSAVRRRQRERRRSRAPASSSSVVPSCSTCSAQLEPRDAFACPRWSMRAVSEAQAASCQADKPRRRVGKTSDSEATGTDLCTTISPSPFFELAPARGSGK